MSGERKKIYLGPGGVFWGDENYRITTVLGSCVSICLWHPEKKIGGICHFRLPGWRVSPRYPLNTAYGDDSIWFMLDMIKINDTIPEDYQVKIFGGSWRFNSVKSSVTNVGGMNALMAVDKLESHGFRISVKNFGGRAARKIIFDLSSGTVLMKKF